MKPFWPLKKKPGEPRVPSKAALRKMLLNRPLPPVLYCCDYQRNGQLVKGMGDLRDYPKGWTRATREQKIQWWRDKVRVDQHVKAEDQYELVNVTIYADYSMIPAEYHLPAHG